MPYSEDNFSYIWCSLAEVITDTGNHLNAIPQVKKHSLDTAVKILYMSDSPIEWMRSIDLS